MGLYIPSYVIEQLEVSKEAELRDVGMGLVDEVQGAVDDAVPRLAAVADAEGGRLMTAAAFMLRANDLLREAREIEGQVHAGVLTLRSVVELAIVGRYFVVGKNAADEFVRRLADGHSEETNLASQLDMKNMPLPDFLASLIDADVKGPRNLAQLAEDLDIAEGRKPGDEGSIVYMYRLLYKHVSSAVTHANAMSIKRYTDRDGHVLMLHQASEPAIRQPNILAAACLLSDLARDVFDALDVPTSGLPDAIRRPYPHSRV